jgi:hypothetical protein
MTAFNAPASSALPLRPQRQLDDYGRFALLLAGAAALVMLFGLFWPRDFFRAYLTAYMLWLGVTLGCLALLMLHHLVGGDWGLLSRRICEAAISRFPIMLLLFLPIVLGVRFLFPWANAEQVAADPILQNKAAYLNFWFWLIRIVVFFGIWMILSARLRGLSHAQDAGTDLKAHEKMCGLSAPGLLLFFLTVTFTAVDLIMSREPHWYSTIIGLLVSVGMGLSGLCLILIVLALIVEEQLIVHQPHHQTLLTADAQPFSNFVSPARLNDFGNLLLTLVILWAYMALAQLIVIWMGNTSEDIPWYTQRGMDAMRPNMWRWYGFAMVVLHFFVPFFILLIKENKRRLAVLGTIALVLLVLRQMDMVWLFAPTITGPEGPESAIGGPASFMDFLAPIAIGGVWFSGFVQALESHPLIPPRDPYAASLLAADSAHESHGGQSEAATQGTYGAAAHTARHVTAPPASGASEGGEHA